jgi:hypothetical protein
MHLHNTPVWVSRRNTHLEGGDAVDVDAGDAGEVEQDVVHGEAHEALAVRRRRHVRQRAPDLDGSREDGERGRADGRGEAGRHEDIPSIRVADESIAHAVTCMDLQNFPPQASALPIWVLMGMMAVRKDARGGGRG